MQRKKIFYSLIFILFVFNLVLGGIFLNLKNQELKIVFFNIGQGDAILIEKGSNQIIIDGGLDGKIELEKLGKYIPFWDRKIELIIATHPDQDHIGGLIDVMKNYEIGKLIDNGAQSDSQVYKKYLDIVSENNIERLEGRKGMKIKEGEMEMEIVYPEILENNPKETNFDSIVIKLVYGATPFLFTGDFPIEKEEKLFQSNVDISADILKVSHHGSKNATSSDFLSRVNPNLAIISVGKNNRYGHPAPELLERLDEKKIKTLRTDQLGDIEYVCKNSKNSCQLISSK